MIKQLNKLKITTLNCKNIKANYMYIEKLIKMNDIVFIQEHWLHNREIDKLDEYLNMEKTNGYLDAEMQIENHCTGRPYGGIGWLINKEIKPEKISFINHRISILKIQEWIILGVYMHANSNNSKRSFDEHMHDVQQLQSIIREFDFNTKILITGDFNSDLNRKSKFDRILQTMINEEGLVSVDQLKYGDKEGIHTFHGANNGKSWIDHVITRRQDIKFIYNLIINEDITNTSDHKAITIELETIQTCEETKTNMEKPNTTNYKSIDWTDTIIIEKYQDKLKRKINRKELEKVKLNETTNRDTLQKEINAQLTQITEILIETTKELEMEIKDQKGYNKKTKKYWWNDKLQGIKNKMNELYYVHKSNKNNQHIKEELKNLRKEFRKEQRLSKYKNENAKYLKLNKLRKK
jgi:hypothetical protein